MTDQRSETAREYRKLYKDPRWPILRKQVLREEPLCRECQVRGRDTLANTADHIIPHRGDRALFFDINNLQPLCASCHSRVKQREEVRGYSAALDDDGWPKDPRHPSNIHGGDGGQS